eukprot:67010-Chlamydomonas_euryale.AAC.1
MADEGGAPCGMPQFLTGGFQACSGTSLVPINMCRTVIGYPLYPMATHTLFTRPQSESELQGANPRKGLPVLSAARQRGKFSPLVLKPAVGAPSQRERHCAWP